MSRTVQYVDTAYVAQVWPHVSQYLEEALTSSPEFPDWATNYTADHVQVFLTAGSWLLVVAVDEQQKIQGACTVSFINYPLHRVAFITAIGGSFITDMDSHSQFKQLLKQRGATKIQGYCRDSVVRLLQRLEFEPRNTLVEALI